LIAADTSSLIAFLSGDVGDDVDAIAQAMATGAFLIPPPALSELLVKGDPDQINYLIQTAPSIPIEEGYWNRAGLTRRMLLGQGLKAKLGDTLIAQCCIDADVPLIARDRDYRHFERWCGLKLAL
jgi:predicted nucleic acid-binding protein